MRQNRQWEKISDERKSVTRENRQWEITYPSREGGGLAIELRPFILHCEYGDELLIAEVLNRNIWRLCGVSKVVSWHYDEPFRVQEKLCEDADPMLIYFRFKAVFRYFFGRNAGIFIFAPVLRSPGLAGFKTAHCLVVQREGVLLYCLFSLPGRLAGIRLVSWHFRRWLVSWHPCFGCPHISVLHVYFSSFYCLVRKASIINFKPPNLNPQTLALNPQPSLCSSGH